ncbi:3TM-type holin [Ruegeria sp.]|uniref:3TM-type holin n=1 Tax=Ruegeria sp. TaxID=1879320 RepID=UPI003B00F48D
MFLRILSGLFGGTRNVATEVIETFRPNAESSAQRAADAKAAALAQFAAEFASPPAGAFDRVVNALNRLPRPVMALGTIALFAFAMWDPQGFAIRMTALELVPDNLWIILGMIMSFYFGARTFEKMRRSRPPKDVARTLKTMAAIEGLRPAQDRPSGETAPKEVASGEVAGETGAHHGTPAEPEGHDMSAGAAAEPRVPGTGAGTARREARQPRKTTGNAALDEWLAGTA